MFVRRSFASMLLLVASPAWFALAQQSSQTGVLSDRDKAGLRGPVKTVLEEQTSTGADSQQFSRTATTQYAPNGKIVSGEAKSAPKFEMASLCTTEAQRLVKVRSGGKAQVRCQDDDKGRRSVVVSYDSTLPPKMAHLEHWEGTELGFPPYPGGTFTTTYNEQGVATGAELRDAEGTLVGHIVRKFDGEGRIISEEQAVDAPQAFWKLRLNSPSFPEEMRSELSNLNSEQMKSVGAMIAGMQNSVISYSYDSQGRLTERRRSNAVVSEQVTVTSYNDHGDVASKRETTIMNPDSGPWRLTDAGAVIPEGKPNPPLPPSSSETQYAYQYDQYGNWTEQTTVFRSQPDEAFRPGDVIRRKLTYY